MPNQIAETTTALNVALSQFNGYFNLFPLYGIVECVNRFNLDASQIVNSFKCDVGRMNVPLSADIWLCVTWYRMESGRFEIVAYASSNYDDMPEPYTTFWTAPQRVKKLRQLNARLRALRSYYATKGLYLADVEDVLKELGFNYHLLQDFASSNSYAGGEGRTVVEVGNSVYLHVSWYQMPSGNYEMVGYAS